MASPKKLAPQTEGASLESAFGIKMPASLTKTENELLKELSTEMIRDAMSLREVATTLRISLKTLQNRMAQNDGHPPFIVLPFSSTKLCPQPWFQNWLQTASTIVRPSAKAAISP
jgi:DNA-binding CsgD family transcriptional regulator